ncbi:ABC transporter substrate-binding protein [Herbaspirillum sp. alder98]|uniref:ABC transporter substrate-binding protein n=1 Tax=Herbaspirillum sp. alder98 TaxID=2913096 RepID=UPI001CD81FCA|nr:ABC transporter substrate-binding protein [Herbaspirillum sp. alder98]MCA1326374.1 ABC transporter substrate-binding protein [Herbaspirillum sp. alder98]
MKKIILQVAVCACAVSASLAHAQISDDKVRIGFISDMSGPFADNDGPGGLEAIRMAVADFGGKVNGKPIEIVSADHQNKADIASAKAREWVDTQRVDMIVGGSNSAAMLSINKLLATKKFVFLVVAAGATQFTNEDCTPYTIQYAYNTTAVARALTSATVKQGGNAWYFLTSDYTFGHSLEGEAAKVVGENGGKVLGKVRHPINTEDFSSFLLQAQSSKANVLGLASSGSDTINAIKGAREFGLTKSMKIAGLLLFVGNVESLGLKNAQGLLLSESWYWDQDDASRAFAKRYFQKMKKMPNSLHAADYSATMNYLKAVQSAGSDDPDKVVKQLRATGINDFYAKGTIREDGQMVHDFHLYEVKTPAESKGSWDYLKKIATVSGDAAFTPLAQSTCARIKK